MLHFKPLETPTQGAQKWAVLLTEELVERLRREPEAQVGVLVLPPPGEWD